MRKLIFLGILISCLPGICQAVRVEQGATQGAGNTVAAAVKPIAGPMRITVTPARDKIRIGDKVQVKVLVEAKPSVTLLKLDYPKILGDWEVLYAQIGKPQYQQNQFVRTDILTLQTFVEGEVDVPSLIQKFKDGEGNVAEFHSAPISIQVEALPPHKGDKPGEIRGLKAPHGMVSWWPIVGLGAALLAAAGLGWYFYRRRQGAQEAAPAAPKRPADEVAFERLNTLKQSSYLGESLFKQYYIELSDILRRYIEEQYGIPAIDWTTYELMREVKKTAIPRQDVHAIRNVLEQSDMVKFAKFLPVASEAQEDWKRVHEIVVHTTEMIKQAQLQETGDQA